jgi:hypothetical protein
MTRSNDGAHPPIERSMKSVMSRGFVADGFFDFFGRAMVVLRERNERLPS